MMEVLSANEAKTQFGNMLLKMQRAPIQINKNGKPVAVVISMDKYESIEALKLRLLQTIAAQANRIASSNSGNISCTRVMLLASNSNRTGLFKILRSK